MSTMSDACYKCKFRGTIPGDAHSCCNHPRVKNITGGSDMFSALVAVMGNPAEIMEAAEELHLRANACGVRNGWFMWPANFDPIWLENCDGFEEKGSQ